MKLAIGATGVKGDQYSYIQVFIDYLRDIIDIIKDLLGFVKKLDSKEDETTTTA